MRGGACLAEKAIGKCVNDRIGVADERDRRRRTRSGSETIGGVLPRSRRKIEASRPTRAPVPLPSLAGKLRRCLYLRVEVRYFPRRIKNRDHGCAGQPLVPRHPYSAAASMGPMGPANHPRRGWARAVQAAAVRRGVLV